MQLATPNSFLICGGKFYCYIVALSYAYFTVILLPFHMLNLEHCYGTVNDLATLSLPPKYNKKREKIPG